MCLHKHIYIYMHIHSYTSTHIYMAQFWNWNTLNMIYIHSVHISTHTYISIYMCAHLVYKWISTLNCAFSLHVFLWRAIYTCFHCVHCVLLLRATIYHWAESFQNNVIFDSLFQTKAPSPTASTKNKKYNEITHRLRNSVWIKLPLF